MTQWPYEYTITTNDGESAWGACWTFLGALESVGIERLVNAKEFTFKKTEEVEEE